jgi:hypothetical protein
MAVFSGSSLCSWLKIPITLVIPAEQWVNLFLMGVVRGEEVPRKNHLTKPHGAGSLPPTQRKPRWVGHPGSDRHLDADDL